MEPHSGASEAMLKRFRQAVEEKLQHVADDIVRQHEAEMRRLLYRSGRSGPSLPGGSTMSIGAAHTEVQDPETSPSRASQLAVGQSSERMRADVMLTLEQTQSAMHAGSTESPLVDPCWLHAELWESDAVLKVDESTIAKRLYPWSSNGSAGSESPRGGLLDFVDSHVVVHPEARARLAWVLLGALLLGFDVLTLPLQLSTLLAMDMKLLVVQMIALGYWIADLPLSFLTGVYHHGVVVMRTNVIASAYLRGWFISDLCIVIVDICAFTVGSTDSDGSAADGTSVVRLLRSARVVRLLRLLRLLRFRRVLEIITRILDSLESQIGFVIARLTGLLLCILLLNHYIACSWYAVGRYEEENGANNWLANCDTHSMSGYYICALHWSLTQFTPATQNLGPITYAERVVATIVVLIALVTFSTFLGRMTSAMSQLISLHADRNQHEVKLRQFIADNKIPKGLAQQIWLVYRQRARLAAMQSKISLSEVRSVFPMPAKLLEAVQVEMHHHHLFSMPILRATLKVAYPECQDLCRSLEEHSAGPLQEVFVERNPTERAFCFTAGDAAYSSSILDEAVKVGKCEWVADIVLWALWKHRGSLNTVGRCSWVTLQASRFRQIIKQQGRAKLKDVYPKYAKLCAASVAAGDWFDIAITEHDRVVRAHIVAEATGSGLDPLANLLRNRRPSAGSSTPRPSFHST